jgi:hypothetical protein
MPEDSAGPKIFPVFITHSVFMQRQFFDELAIWQLVHPCADFVFVFTTEWF